MKQKMTFLLIALTIVLAAFLTGFFLGRNLTSAPLSLSTVTTVPVSTEQTDDTSLIDLNAATLADLTTLPGIGEVLATRILTYREENGPFTSLSQLMNIEGIGAQRLTDLLPYITIGG